MPTRPLPNDPSLEHLRKDAKRLRKSVREKDPAAISAVREFHPRAGTILHRFSLADAQLTVARSYGFSNWARLKAHLAEIAPFVWHAPPPPNPAALEDVFLRLACLLYGDWHRTNPARAHRLLNDHPELANASIYTASAIGNVDAVRAALTANPQLVNAKGGPFGWEPLLYACYSRFDNDDPRFSTLEVARLLLSRGADPNAGFLWGGSYAFTALTGAFGEGEDGLNQPPHPRAEALARLLLDAGADPNDSQALYNKHFKTNDDHLRLLLAYGLGTEKGGPWLGRLNARDVTPSRLLVEELWSAAKNNVPKRVALLVEHGADVNTPGLRNGRRPYEEARRAGNDAIAEYLLQHGARRIDLDLVEAFASACAAGRLDEARQALATDPALVEKLGRTGQVELIHRAVEAGRLDAVRFVVGLGVDVNGLIPNTGLDRTPLHNAAMTGDLAMVQLLIELGGNLGLRDSTYHATPIAWAAHGDQQHVVQYLLSSATIFDAVQCGGVERAIALLEQDPPLASAVDDGGNPLAFYLHAEMPRLHEMLPALVSRRVSLNRRGRSGRTLLDRALAYGQVDFAERLRSYGARTSAELGAGPESGGE